MTISRLTNFCTSTLETFKPYVPTAKTLVTSALAGAALASTAYYFLSSQNSGLQPAESSACYPQSIFGFETPFENCVPISKLEEYLPLAKITSSITEKVLKNGSVNGNLTGSFSEALAHTASNASSLVSSVIDSGSCIAQTLVDKANETASQIFNQSSEPCFDHPATSPIQSIVNSTTSLFSKGIEFISPIAIKIAQQFGTNNAPLTEIAPSAPIVAPSELPDGSSSYVGGGLIATVCVLVPLAAYYLCKSNNQKNSESRELVPLAPKPTKFETQISKLLATRTLKEIHDAFVFRVNDSSLFHRPSTDPKLLKLFERIHEFNKPKPRLAIPFVVATSPAEPSADRKPITKLEPAPALPQPQTKAKRKKPRGNSFTMDQSVPTTQSRHANRPTKSITRIEESETSLAEERDLNPNQFMRTILLIQAFMAAGGNQGESTSSTATAPSRRNSRNPNGQPHSSNSTKRTPHQRQNQPRNSGRAFRRFN